MKKLLGIVVLGLLLSGNANSQNLKPLKDYLKQNEGNSSDPDDEFTVEYDIQEDLQFIRVQVLDRVLH